MCLQGRARDWSRLAADSKGRRSGTPRNGEARAPLDEAGAGDALTGARVGIFWEDDKTFYKVFQAFLLLASFLSAEQNKTTSSVHAPPAPSGPNAAASVLTKHVSLCTGFHFGKKDLLHKDNINNCL